MRSHRSLIGVALAAVLFPGAVGSAHAAMHLRLEKSEPAANATVTAPAALKLWFSLAPAMQVTSVKLAAGPRAVRLGKPARDTGDAAPVTVSVDEPLAAGKYTVTWKTASRDLHPVTGSYSFTVR